MSCGHHAGLFRANKTQNSKLETPPKKFETFGEMCHVWRICEWRFGVLSRVFSAQTKLKTQNSKLHPKNLKLLEKCVTFGESVSGVLEF